METADGPVRFRILAGAAHSWATVLLESEPGARFVYTLATGGLEQIDAASADRLMGARAYRPWLGPRGWTSLEALPIVGIAAASAWPAAGAGPAPPTSEADQPGAE